MTAFQNELDALLRPVVQSGRAPAMRAYMRDQFEFMGIATPDRRAAAKALLKRYKGASAEMLLATAQSLWELPQREYQYVALDLLAMHYRALGPEHIPVLLEFVQRKSWWDTVDGLAAIIGDILNGRHDHMDGAINHQDFWVRRIAILHQLGWREKVDAQRLFNYALSQGHEKEFFIQKAIGWALRDYARHAPDLIRDFVATNKNRLAPLTVREAAKHL
ncbi:MAG: DNA alkylation repair protein [Burkholderiaceae bacterium]|nr:DNA alkylation repair protein [Burkholderiaceae bacterium]